MRGRLKLRFSSTLPLTYRDELERIVFFNPAQSRATDRLLAVVHRYGVPVIRQEGKWLRLGVPALPAVQTLYALDESVLPASLVGVAMFVREQADTMLVLHLAVHEDYTGEGPMAGAWLAPRLVAAVREVCLQIRGVTTLHVLYPTETRFVLRPPPSQPAADAVTT